MRRLFTARALGRGLVAVVLLGALLVVWSRQRGVLRERKAAAVAGAPRTLDPAAFAGSAVCADCHPEHHDSWRRTFHRTMTQEVSPAHPEAVAGDFGDARYTYDGVSVRMHRDGAGRPVMSFAREGDAGQSVDAVVVRTVGSRRYQQYLTEVAGVLWRLPMAYHLEERRWFHMNGAFLTPDPEPAGPGSERQPPSPPSAHAAPAPRDTTPRFGGGAFDRHVTRWNDNCVFCHNVAPNPGWDAASGNFRTTVAELGIACEACHGPGAAHVARNQGDPLRRYTLRLAGAADSTIVNPARLSPGRAADVCGRCHGQRISDDVGVILARGDPFVPGDDLGLYTSPLWRDTSLGGDSRAFAARFWDDGTPRLTAYEYQGLLQSACATRGALTCTTCHGMHDGAPRGQLRPVARGDGACTGCHVAMTSTAARAAHTRHDPAGPGARCVSCHMPRLVYGVLDAHRSHRIERPEPARAVATGRPDACTLCHVEQGRAWAVRERARLWPATSAAPAGNSNMAAPPPSPDLLAPRDALFAGDPVARALAADALGRAPWPAEADRVMEVARSRSAALLEAAAGDRYPAVRHLAARALERILLARGLPGAMETHAFDATAPEPERQRILGIVRRLLSAPDARKAADIMTLRRLARSADIDIGE